MNPLSQFISRVSVDFAKSLSTGLIPGKPSSKAGDSPLLSEARNSMIFIKPSFVKCSFFNN